MNRRRRILSSAEIELWQIVTRHVEPLRESALSVLESEPPTAPAAESVPGGKPPKLPKTAPSQAVSKTASPPKPAIPPLVPLERRLKRGLARGSHPIHAVLDLHGLRQDEAHARLRAFISRTREEGAVVVLVVTGKGARATEASSHGEERGVLRRMVPHWLRMPELRGMVVGFEEAAPHQGGAGALYVRLRRRRGPGDAE
jgi:DNA-nicking Smr family endonuclease